jgi:alanine racemase
MADKGTFILYSSPEKRPLEEVASLFVGSLGRTRLYVDLDSMGENIRAFNSKTQPGVEIMAVVKSFGYGHDSVAASRIALENNVKYLAVAIPDEGVFLRENHINAPILVFNVCASSDTAKLLDYDLAATVTSFDMAKTLDRAASKDRKIKAHLKIDTGMGRSGVWFEDAIDFVKDCMSLGNLDTEGIMTHLSSADDPGEDCFTMEQIKAFQRLVDDLKSMGVSFKFVHAANTAAIARFPRSHFNMVRPGLGVYGMYPSDAVREEIHLKPVITFTTHISQIKEHPPGRSISYGRRYITDKPSRIATLPVGYNDGYPRFQSNRGRVLIRGKEAPVRGTVCMDAIMADITAIPEAQIGDEAVLIGRQGAKEISVDEIADNGGTINYEITCKISPRVQRIFLKS